MQKLIFLIIFLSMSITLMAQNKRLLTPDGKLHPINEVKKIKVRNEFNPQIKSYNFPSGPTSGIYIDTLRYIGPWNVALECKLWFLRTGLDSAMVPGTYRFNP